jgi:hypothetical protein
MLLWIGINLRKYKKIFCSVVALFAQEECTLQVITRLLFYLEKNPALRAEVYTPGN